MAPELVVTPGGQRPAEIVYKIGGDLKLRILTSRMQGSDASDTPVADYGSIPRDGENPALTPGYALPPGIETPEGSEPAASFGRGWISFAHWRNEGSEPISSFRSTMRVPPEPESRSGQTVFLFLAMQDPIPMTLMPALQWGPSAAGGGEYWSVASWYVGGTTGAVFHGELVPVNAGDELTTFVNLERRQRAHFDYRCGFEGLSDADLPVYHVRELSRSGTVLAAYGIKQCTDYPAANATGFRNIELKTGFRHPPLAWNPANTITDCGQHVVVLSDANPGGEVDVHYRQFLEMPTVEPEAAVAEAAPEEVTAAPEEVEAEPEPMAATASEPDAAALVPEPAMAEATTVAPAPAIPNLEVHPRIDRLVEITIHNHSPAVATSGALEARVASLESTMAALAQMIAASGQTQSGVSVNGDLAASLEQLVQLKGSGALDDTEFAAAKAQLIGVRVDSNGWSVT